MKIKPHIERHPLVAYFCIAFGFSWGGALLTMLLQGYQVGSGTRDQVIIWFFPMIAGPTLACTLLTAILEGRAGLKNMLERMIRWRVAPHWHAVALLTNPLIVLATSSILAFVVSPVYQPVFNPALMIFGLGAGIFEEIGWTGFVTPRIVRKPVWLPAAIGFGILHGLWHLPVDFFGSSYSMGPYWLPNYLVFWIGALAAYRVLMVWVYKHTESLLLGIFMHTVFTGSFMVFWPALSPAELMTWGALYSASLWLIVAGLALSQRKTHTRNLIEVHK